MKRTDVLVCPEGTIVLFELLTHRAERWGGEHVQPDAQFFDRAQVVEHRCVGDIASALQRDGFRVGLA